MVTLFLFTLSIWAEASWKLGDTLFQDCYEATRGRSTQYEESVVALDVPCSWGPGESCYLTERKVREDGVLIGSAEVYYSPAEEAIRESQNRERLKSCKFEDKRAITAKNLDNEKVETFSACQMPIARKQYRNQSGDLVLIEEQETIAPLLPLGLPIEAMARVLQKEKINLDIRCVTTGFRRGSH